MQSAVRTHPHAHKRARAHRIACELSRPNHGQLTRSPPQTCEHVWGTFMHAHAQACALLRTCMCMLTLTPALMPTRVCVLVLMRRRKNGRQASPMRITNRLGGSTGKQTSEQADRTDPSDMPAGHDNGRPLQRHSMLPAIRHSTRAKPSCQHRPEHSLMMVGTKLAHEAPQSVSNMLHHPS